MGFNMSALIEKMKQNYTILKSDNHADVICEFYDGCFIDIKSKFDIASFFCLSISQDYQEFLQLSNGAKLFYDAQYGQSGLWLYNGESLEQKNYEWKTSYLGDDILTGDLIIGEFLGDSDLLILRCDKSKEDFGKIVISLPIDERKDWYFLNDTFIDFLEKFANNQGEKYWET